MTHTILLVICMHLMVHVCQSRQLLDAPYFAGPNTPNTGYDTWADAQADCQSQSGRLATFHTEADIQAMSDVCNQKNCYTGWSDMDLDGTYTFVTGETMNDLGAWGPDEPHNDPIQHCGCVGDSGGPLIADCICDVSAVNTLPMGAVCEDDITAPPSTGGGGIILPPPSPTPGCDCLYYFDGCNHCSCDPATGVSTCTAMFCDPWGEYECLDAKSNCTAKVCAHGDNRIHLDISYDSGSNWDFFVVAENNWKNTLTHAVSGIDENTVFRFTVYDAGVIGGFLCTVQLCGDNGYIFDFYTDESNVYFDVISDSAGDPLLDDFHAFGTGPWQAFVNEDKVSCMNEKADWMWNDKTYNHMVFELNFGHHLDILQRLECIDSTPAPSTVDCCDAFDSVSDYLGQCYCDSVALCPCLHYFDGCNQCWCDPTNGQSVCTEMWCDPWGDYECLDGLDDPNAAASVGSYVMDEKNEFNKNGARDSVKLSEQMKDIKDLMYATWIIIFIFFAAGLVVNSFASKKTKRLE